MISKLLIATNNKNKLQEFETLFLESGIEITSLAVEGIHYDVEETGKTFEDNAILKATEYCKLSGLPTLADDSGLIVDALDGRPGVYSARYAGENATSEDRCIKLLEELRGVPFEKRTARYKAVLALALPDGKVETVEGLVEGSIAEEQIGTSGFGYDPLFYVEEFKTTFANISQEQKNSISHRSKALYLMIEIIKNLDT